MRKLTGYAGGVVAVVAVVMSAYHVYARLTPAAPDGLVLRVIALAFCLTLAFLLFPFKATTPLDEETTYLFPEGASTDPSEPSPGTAPAKPALGRPDGISSGDVPWIDLLLAGVSLAALGYVFVYYSYITERFPPRIRSP